MNTKFLKLFNDAESLSSYKFQEEKWGKTNRIHDWRNHVSWEFLEIWEALPFQVKQTIFIIAAQSSNEEDWD